MTLMHKSTEDKVNTMNGIPSKEDTAKPLRPVRNRRFTRRSFVAGQRPQKRLFTPEIKRYLKDWLVRRRENPYPNREEKKHLANETGLTYVQICNWFANWRRKLKNVTEDRNQKTWGHLIRTYNDRAQGNVEHFSICSEDSIWSEHEPHSLDEDMQLGIDISIADTPEPSDPYEDFQEESDSSIKSKENREIVNNNTYKMDTLESQNETKNVTGPLLLSKWLESAARFQPSDTNYSCWAEGNRRKPQRTTALTTWSKHGRDEVEAAVALTALASSRVTAP